MAFALGVAGDVLLRSVPWGINIFLWIGFLMLAVITTARWTTPGFCFREFWFIVPALLFAGGFAGRDSAVLKTLNAAGLFISLALVIGRQSDSILNASLAKYAREAVDTLGNSLTGFPHLLCRDVEWPRVSDPRFRRQAVAIGTGLIVSIPLLLGFGGLFMAADAVYKKILSDLIRLDLPELFTHLSVAAGCAWLAGGYLRASLFNEYRPPIIPTVNRRVPLLIETNVVLIVLNALFLSFVVVQFQYLFGGAAHVEITPGVTYAEYARHGFFELVTVAAMAFPLLLLADWLLGAETDKRLFRILSATLVLLLFIIMASALQRMHLYQDQYGWTELRFYTTAFMIWLGVLFFWFLATVLRGSRGRFAFGMLMTGFVMMLGLNFLNPDDFIVKSNVRRASEGRHFDATYAASLSADAIPALTLGLSKLEKADQEMIRQELLKKSSLMGINDWRNWNYSRAVAFEILSHDF